LAALRDGWDATRLEAALYPCSEATAQAKKSPPDFAAVHEQLRSHRHVTMQLLWEEYREHPESYRHSRVCELYQRWRKKLDVVMRQEQKAGEKAFIDWAGSTIPIHGGTGAVKRALFFA
jgi:transposase